MTGGNPLNSHSFFKNKSLAAVLVAIAIPVFTSQLEKSREATDISNARGYYAEIAAWLLADNPDDGATTMVQGKYTATIDGDPHATGTFDVGVAGVPNAQRVADWQTADFNIAGVPKAQCGSAVTSTTADITYTFTVETDGDMYVSEVAFAEA